MDWQTRRKFLYLLSFIVVLIATAVYFSRDILFPEPTCVDKKQNGFEVGVDCGGVCAVRCTSEIIPLSVAWARVIRTSTTTYDIVGMVSNKNINHAAHIASYVFTAYDDSGNAIQEIKGVTLTPVNGDFPIVRQNVSFKVSPKTVSLTLADGPHYNVNEKPTSPTVSVGNERYEYTLVPRVYATVQNRKRMTIRNLPIKVILFDQDNNAYAVGETVIPELGKEELKEVSFTWNYPLPFPPTRIRAYPIFDPFLTIQ
jgi:hypothetical protein